jgi:DNA repair exonuclease SbcCD nuclease subunit
MAKKKKVTPKQEEDDIPEGKVDEEGDEILDLYDEKDNLDDDLDYDLNDIEDEMLTDETEDEEFGYEISEVESLMRKVKCAPCPGSSSKRDCKVRDDFGCPPDKADK